MNIAGLFLLALSLSMDALGVGVTYGMGKIKIKYHARLIIFSLSFLFTAASVFLGARLSEILPGHSAKFVGVIMLILLGIYIIYNSMVKGGKEKKPQKKDESQRRIFKFFIKTWGITVQIIKDPEAGDRDKSNSIDPVEALYIGLALSVDSLCAGVAGAAIGITSVALPLLTALSQVGFISAGELIGKKIAGRAGKGNKIFSALPGVLLILLAVLRLL